MVSRRDFSERIRTQLHLEEDGYGYAIFVVLKHPGLTEPIRIVCDVIDFMFKPDGESLPQLFQSVLFNISLVTDSEDMPTAQISIPNIDRRLGLAISALDSEPEVEIYITSREDFDFSQNPAVPIETPEIIYSAKKLRLSEVQANQISINGTLASWKFRNEPWPTRYTSKDAFPGLYR